jgi:hypothetical protein
MLATSAFRAEERFAGFGVQLRGTCNPSSWHDTYTSQMLHVWAVPYPGGVFSDDLSLAATNSAVQAAMHHGHAPRAGMTADAAGAGRERAPAVSGVSRGRGR